MPFSPLPKIITDKLTDITPELLRERKIRLLMLDFDNTIVPYTTSVATEKMDAWLTEMAASDILLCVVSNSKKDRVKIFWDQWGMDCITRSKKPFPKLHSACSMLCNRALHSRDLQVLCKSFPWPADRAKRLHRAAHHKSAQRGRARQDRYVH